MKTLRVDVVSDVVCPWCFIGKRRLEAAALRLEGVVLDVHWRPFQLDHTIPRAGMPRETYLMNKFRDKGRIDAMFERLTQVGAEIGIPFAFDKIKVSPNTLDAHRLIRWAEPLGLQNLVKEQLMRGYFIEGGNLADLDQLAGYAARAGMDFSATRVRLGGDEDVDAVRADIEWAHRIGVTGVPFFILGGALALPGAHDVQVMADAIAQALQMAETAAA